MADHTDNAEAWNEARDRMRREGMKRGPKFKPIDKEAFDAMLEHERLLASAAKDHSIERKPTTYRLKSRRK